MKKIAVLVLMAVFLSLSASLLYAEEKTGDEVLSIATDAVKGKNFMLEDVSIIYDEDGKLWNERIGYLAEEDKSPNHGILRKGFLKNYKVVLFDYKEPLPDIWVFVDKDTGEVLEVYREKK